MAVINFTKEVLSTDSIRVTWPNVTGSDTGAPFSTSGFNDNTFQVLGPTFDGAVTIEGSNDDSTFATLTDVHNNACSYTAAAIATLTEACSFIRPAAAAGTSDNTVIVIFRRG